MSANLKISHKGIILVTVPLIFELLLVTVLIVLLEKTDAEISREAKARKLSSQNSLVARDMLDFMVGVAGCSVLQTSAFKEHYDRSVEALPSDVDKLVKMLEDQPEKQKIAMSIRDNFRDGVMMANDARIKMESGDTAEVLLLLPKLKRRSFDASMKLNQLAADERIIERDSPKKQAELRRQLMYCLWISVIFNFALSGVLVVYFSRSITDRLKVLTQNSTRLAVGHELLPHVGGADEIAALDTAFRGMVKALADANSRERALVENAQDIICSLDSEGRFLSVNAVAHELLGFDAEYLIGRRVIDILETYSKEPFTAALDALSRGTNNFPLETNVVCKDQMELDISWSAHWSGSEKTFSCVAHNITERKNQERLIKLAEAKFRSIIESIPVAIAVSTKSGTIEMVNPALLVMFGYNDSSSIVGASLSSLFVPGQSKRSHEGQILTISPDELVGAPIKCEAHRRDGTAFPAELACLKFEQIDGNRYLATIIDVSKEEEIERLKQEFRVVLSHELRSPLTSLKLLLELIFAGAYGPLSEQGLTKVSLAERNIGRLVNLIQELLDIELVEMGRLKIEKERIDLSEVIDSAVESCQGPAAKAEVELKVDSEPLTIDADEDRLTQVLINLISNAVKFSPKGAVVEITTRLEAASVVVSVRDDGPGIPGERQTQIFERFKQGSAEAARKKGSVGLGLAISKAIVEVHGGTIGVDSEEGAGSTFWFRLPVKLPAGL